MQAPVPIVDVAVARVVVQSAKSAPLREIDERTLEALTRAEAPEDVILACDLRLDDLGVMLGDELSSDEQLYWKLLYAALTSMITGEVLDHYGAIPTDSGRNIARDLTIASCEVASRDPTSGVCGLEGTSAALLHVAERSLPALPGLSMWAELIAAGWQTAVAPNGGRDSLQEEILLAANNRALHELVTACLENAVSSRVTPIRKRRAHPPSRSPSTTSAGGSSPGQWTELELIERMLAREVRAWREFHGRYDRLIYRAIHKVTQRFSSVVGSSDVEEIYALLLCSMNGRDMHKLRTFEPDRGHRLSTWVGLLATNAAWDYLRTLSRQPLRGSLEEAEDVTSANNDPFHTLAAKEEWSRVRDALSGFSEKDRTFVDLFFLQGRSPEQIADEMQISVKTVYSKKHKIRARLESALGRPAPAKHRGTILWFNDKKGYGYVDSGDGGPPVFVRQSQLRTGSTEQGAIVDYVEHEQPTDRYSAG